MKPHIEQVTVDTRPDKDIRAWLAEQAKSYELTFLLAHADDGVIWGLFENDRLTLAGDVFTALQTPLREATLQQARLFGDKGELLVWRTESGLAARVLTDVQDDTPSLPDEKHFLWGTGEASDQGFTLMREGEQELLHAPPLKDGKGKRAALLVRHYTYVDDQGQAYIGASRLVTLTHVPTAKRP